MREVIVMTDQQLAVQAVSDAQRILEEYLEPRPHNNERILDRLVEVLERPNLLVAVDRLQRGNG
jgi:hypothetical protein